MSALRASGSSSNGGLRVAVPNKGTLSELAAEILSEAGYRRRTDPKDLTVVDPVNNVEFFFLRPKDIAIYVGSGQLDFGITGRDLAWESDAPVRERLALGFGSSTFRYAAPADKQLRVEDLAGKRIATAFPNLVRKDLAARGIEATVIRLDGAVEISVQLGVADAIADVVGSGRTLGLHDLVAAKQSALDQQIQTKISAALISFDQITERYEQAIYTQRIQVKNTMDLLDDVNDLLENDLTDFINTNIKD